MCVCLSVQIRPLKIALHVTQVNGYDVTQETTSGKSVALEALRNTDQPILVEVVRKKQSSGHHQLLTCDVIGASHRGISCDITGALNRGVSNDVIDVSHRGVGRDVRSSHQDDVNVGVSDHNSKTLMKNLNILCRTGCVEMMTSSASTQTDTDYMLLTARSAAQDIQPLDRR